MKWMAWTSLLLYEGGNLVYYYSHSVTVCFQTPYLNSLRTYLDASYTAYVKCMHANKWQTAWTVRLSPPCSSVLVTQGIIARCLYIYIYSLCVLFLPAVCEMAVESPLVVLLTLTMSGCHCDVSLCGSGGSGPSLALKFIVWIIMTSMVIPVLSSNK